MRVKLSLVLLCFGVLGLSHSVLAQLSDDLLPRRGYFGVGLEKADGGARVFSVAPDSTAAASDIRIGDVIEAVDDSPITSPQLVVELLGRHKAGQSVKINVHRDGNRRTIDAMLKPFPFEQMANATVQYGSVVALPDVRLRTILSIPSGTSGTRLPAVLLIQGGGCGCK